MKNSIGMWTTIIIFGKEGFHILMTLKSQVKDLMFAPKLGCWLQSSCHIVILSACQVVSLSACSLQVVSLLAFQLAHFGACFTPPAGTARVWCGVEYNRPYKFNGWRAKELPAASCRPTTTVMAQIMATSSPLARLSLQLELS